MVDKEESVNKGRCAVGYIRVWTLRISGGMSEGI